MRIPEVRKELAHLAATHGLPRLQELADELVRRPAVRRAPRRSRPVTGSIERAIVAYAAAYPTASVQAIANVFDLNIGRVSEALGGKRT